MSSRSQAFREIVISVLVATAILIVAGQRHPASTIPSFSHSEINAIPFNGQQAVTAITALWLWCPTAFRWLQQPIGRHLVIDVAKQVIQRHPEVKNEGIPEILVLPAMTAEVRFNIDASSVAKIKVRKCRLGDDFLHNEL
jgi:hypothetical protein